MLPHFNHLQPHPASSAPHGIVDLNLGESKLGRGRHRHLAIQLQLETCAGSRFPRPKLPRPENASQVGQDCTLIHLAIHLAPKYIFEVVHPESTWSPPGVHLESTWSPPCNIPGLRSKTWEIRAPDWTLRSSCRQISSFGGFAWTPPRPRCGEPGSHTSRGHANP